MAGRPRKSRARKRCGRLKPEQEDVIRSTVLSYRRKQMHEIGLGSWIDKERRGRDVRTEDDPLADPLNGFTLGLLRQRNAAYPGDPSGINQAQFDAGEKWSTLCRQHASIMGYEIGSTKSPSFVLVSRGSSCSAPPEQSVINTVRRNWQDCYNELRLTGNLLGQGAKVALICWAVCVQNRALEGLTQEDYGNLRAGLNALARVLR